MTRRGGWVICLAILATCSDLRAQESWTAPFGGSWSAKLALLSDYSYHGISQTERGPAVQAALSYDVPLGDERVYLHLEAWGSNVRFSSTVLTEFDVSAALLLYPINRLGVEVWYSRYNYLEAPSNLKYDYNELNLTVHYDFSYFRLSGSVSYSPNYFADAGNSWYKWAEIVVPLRFVRLDEHIALKAFGSIGNQYLERFANDGLPSDTYWDWEIGLKARVYGVYLSASYVATNIDVAGCGGTRNCEGRAVFKMTKVF
jgi:uncharacterized protein (TIGR02001 family)